MKTVGLKALKNQLSAYVRAAAAGEIVLVTDRDAVVAQLGPAPADVRISRGDDDVFARGVREGWLTPAAIAPGPMPKRSRARVADDELQRGLEEDRADRS